MATTTGMNSRVLVRVVRKGSVNVSFTFLLLSVHFFEICTSDDPTLQTDDRIVVMDRLETINNEMGTGATLLSVGSVSLLILTALWFCGPKSSTTIEVSEEAKDTIEIGRPNHGPQSQEIRRLGISRPVPDSLQWIDMEGDTFTPEVYEKFSQESTSLRSVKTKGVPHPPQESLVVERFKTLERIDEESDEP